MIGKAEEDYVHLTENIEAKQATSVDALAVVKQRRRAEVVLVRAVQDFGENNKQDASIIHSRSRPSLSLLQARNGKGQELLATASWLHVQLRRAWMIGCDACKGHGPFLVSNMKA